MALAEDDRLFPQSLADKHRRWFTRRVLEQLRAAQPGLSADALENLARNILATTRDQALATQRPAVDGEPPADAARRWTANDARVEAVYGLVGNDVAAGQDPARFRIAVERRARLVDRMIHSVGANPNPQGATPNAFRDGFRRAFEYPIEFAAAPPPGTVAASLFGVEEKLNPQAEQYWRRLRRGVFVLRASANDVRQALDALFVTYDDHYRRNYLGCEQVISILHMDSLAEVGDPNLYATLRGQHESYLRIGNPGDIDLDFPYARITVTGADDGLYTATILGRPFSVEARQSTPTRIRDALAAEIKRGGLPLHATAVLGDTLGLIPHYLGAVRRGDLAVISTGSPLALRYAGVVEPPERIFTTEPNPALRYFRQGSVAFESLCVGDHVYVRNHPVYETVAPGDYWAGEHCLVVRGMGGDIHLQGHGIPIRSMDGVIHEMLAALQPRIRATQEAVLAHWRSPLETNADGTPGLPKSRNANGTTQRLYLRRFEGRLVEPPVPIHRDPALEQTLAPDRAIASWYVLYRETQETRFYLFNADDGKPVAIKPESIPGLQPGIRGMAPPQVWAIRPDLP